MSDRVDLLRAAAEGRAPCRECGHPHSARAMPRGGVTWAGRDGHTYRRMDVVEFARLLLDTLKHESPAT